VHHLLGLTPGVSTECLASSQFSRVSIKPIRTLLLCGLPPPSFSKPRPVFFFPTACSWSLKFVVLNSPAPGREGLTRQFAVPSPFPFPLPACEEDTQRVFTEVPSSFRPFFSCPPRPPCPLMFFRPASSFLWMFQCNASPARFRWYNTPHRAILWALLIYVPPPQLAPTFADRSIRSANSHIGSERALPPPSTSRSILRTSRCAIECPLACRQFRAPTPHFW